MISKAGRVISKRCFSSSLRLVNFNDGNGMRLGAETSDGMICDMTSADPSIPNEMKAFLQAGEDAKTKARSVLSQGTNLLNPSSVKRLSPIYGPEKIICIGMNYIDHCTEQNFPVPTEPIIFNKFPNTIIGPDEGIVLDPETAELDYEVELAVVIGKTGKKISKENAMDYVGGYTV